MLQTFSTAENITLYSEYNPYLFFLVYQCILAVVLGETCRSLDVVRYRGFQLSTAAIWLPVNVCFVLMLLTSFMSFKYLNVPMITVFKNLTNVIIVAGDWYWHQQKITLGVLIAFGIMVIGAMAAAYTDIMFSAEGYLWMGGEMFLIMMLSDVKANK